MTKATLKAKIEALIFGSHVTDVSQINALKEILKAVALPLEVTDITALTAAQLDALEVGDSVIKVTGTDKHLYHVTYKATTGGGICLSYNACGYGETVSYDRTESGWQYNSTDVKTYGE